MKIIIADDHPIFRKALCQTIYDFSLNLETPIAFFESADLATTHTLLTTHENCDLVLLDLHMPDAQGFSGLVNLRGCFPFVPIAIISGSDSPYIIHRSASLGASGFISKSATPEKIQMAITTLLLGENYFPQIVQNEITLDVRLADIAQRIASLTPHQFRVFTLINQGLLNKQIAYELKISETTVKSHVKMILKKMRVRKRTEVIILTSALHVEQPDYHISHEQLAY